MNDHVGKWLAAYHDGELQGARLKKIETHLATCEPCQAELDQLNALSQLLNQAPAADNLLPADLFVSQVGLRLARRPTRPAWRQALLGVWWLIPAGLLGSWVFVKTLMMQILWMNLAAILGLSEELNDLRTASSSGEPALWFLAFSAVIGLAFLGWLTSWWIRSQRGTPGIATE